MLDKETQRIIMMQSTIWEKDFLAVFIFIFLICYNLSVQRIVVSFRGCGWILKDSFEYIRCLYVVLLTSGLFELLYFNFIRLLIIFFFLHLCFFVIMLKLAQRS